MQREITLQNPAIHLNKRPPHLPRCRIIRIGKVNRTVKEFLKVLLAPVMRLTRTPNNRDARIISDPFCLPLDNRFLDSTRVDQLNFFSLAELLPFLFLGGPDLFTLIDVDDGRLVRFCTFHNHRHHLVRILPSSSKQVSSLNR